MGLLRLLTTAAVMNDSSLSMKKAWKAYDGFLGGRTSGVPGGAPALEKALRALSSSAHASPKLWADAYLIAFAKECGGSLVTFDRTLAASHRRQCAS